MAVDPHIGTTIANRYQVLAAFEPAGSVSVYKGREQQLGRDVLLHLWSYSAAADASEDFHNRFSAIARLSHPNTVSMLDYGRSAELYFVASEWVSHQRLSTWMGHKHGEAEACGMVRQIAASLKQSHAQSVLHGGLTPAAVWLPTSQPNFPKVGAFPLGTPHRGNELAVGVVRYMAPEQIRREPNDERTDVYGLGTILYELLVGEVPFSKGTPIHVAMDHLNIEPPSPCERLPKLSRRCESVVLTALAKQADDRFQSMEEFISSLPA